MRSVAEISRVGASTLPFRMPGTPPGHACPCPAIVYRTTSVPLRAVSIAVFRDVAFGLALRDGRASVDARPGRYGVRHRPIGARLGAGKLLAAGSTLVGHVLVVGAMKDDHRDRLTRRARVGIERAGDRCDRRDPVGELAAKAVRQHRAVGKARGVDALAVDPRGARPDAGSARG
jgi:hypothetical protein